MKHLIAWLILLMPVATWATEALPDRAAAQALAEAVMTDVGADRFKEGVQRLRPFAIITTEQFDVQFMKLHQQLPLIAERFGKPVGHELVRTEELGESIVQFVYLQKFEQHFLVWRFVFYRAREQWLLNTWSFDDKYRELLGR